MDACPLCRAALHAGDDRCPDCGADLAPFTDLEQLTGRYVEFCRELISRGDVQTGRQIVQRLPQITSAAATEIAELRARIALVEGDYTAARLALAGCTAEVSAVLAAEIKAGEARQFQAHELYNLGLAAAQRGAFPAAAELLERAVNLEPDDPSIWALKLKTDLKCAHFQRCYATLVELDRLSARPPEFFELERLLPPVAGS